jgi:hypothetical protein
MPKCKGDDIMLKKLSCSFQALNHILFAVILLLVFSAVGACEEKLQIIKELTEGDIKNADFLLDEYMQDKTIRLKEGAFEDSNPDSYYSMGITKIVMGDMNGDGNNDAAVIYVWSGGGSGHFYTLAAVLNKDGKPMHVATEELGDRIIIKSVTIDSGKIIIDMVVHGPDEPLCCPTKKQIVKYGLEKNKLKEMK